MKVSALFILLAGSPFSANAYAQGLDLRGVVIDSTTGERIPLVTVTITGTRKGGFTNAQGFYLIPNVPYGRLEVVASAIGYERGVSRLNVQQVENLTLIFSPRRVRYSANTIALADSI